jgi:hypothetical protein
MSAEPDNKRLKPADENRALIVARIKQDYQRIVFANLAVIQECFKRNVATLDAFHDAWCSPARSTNPLVKIQLFVDHCYELQAIRRDIRNLDKYPPLIAGFIRQIDDPTETKGMAKVAFKLEQMSSELSKAILSVYEQTDELRKLYLTARENLSLPLDAFMQPWLNPRCRDAISQSLTALEAIERTVRVNDNGPDFIRAHRALAETQLPKAGV